MELSSPGLAAFALPALEAERLHGEPFGGTAPATSQQFMLGPYGTGTLLLMIRASPVQLTPGGSSYRQPGDEMGTNVALRDQREAVSSRWPSPVEEA